MFVLTKQIKIFLITYYQVFCCGLGLSISFPESSQDMLKSANTCLARDVIIDVAMTFLCTPVKSNIT